MIRQTHTFVLMDISRAAYDEIAAKLKAAEYDQAFIEDDGKNAIKPSIALVLGSPFLLH